MMEKWNKISSRRDHRDCTRWSHGNAWVQWSAAKPLTVIYHKEGSMEEFSSMTCISPEMVEALGVEVLSTGRTVEVGKGVNLRKLGWSLAGTPVSEPWAAMANAVRGRAKYMDMKMSNPRPLNLSPDYQRGSVWDEARQRAFIGHLLEGGTCPNLYIARSPDGTETVVDGKQRLLAVTAFIEGAIPGDVTLPDGSIAPLWYKDFDERDRLCPQMDLPIVYGRWTREEQIRFYLRLNSGGVAHTPEELAKARELWLQAKANPQLEK
jgi:hypothetical protein